MGGGGHLGCGGQGHLGCGGQEALRTQGHSCHCRQELAQAPAWSAIATAWRDDCICETWASRATGCLRSMEWAAPSSAGLRVRHEENRPTQDTRAKWQAWSHPWGEAGRTSSPQPSTGRPHAPSAQHSRPHPASRVGRRHHCALNRGAGRGQETPGWLDQGHRLRDWAHIPLVSTQACKPPPPLRQGRPILDSRPDGVGSPAATPWSWKRRRDGPREAQSHPEETGLGAAGT